MGFYTIFYDVYVLMFWRRVLPSSSCQLNFFGWMVRCLGREITSIVQCFGLLELWRRKRG